MKFNTLLRGTECHLYVCFTHQSTSLLHAFILFGVCADVYVTTSEDACTYLHVDVYKNLSPQNIQWCPRNKDMLYHLYEIVGHFEFQNAHAFVFAVTYQLGHLTILKTWPRIDALMLYRQITPHGSLQRLRIRHLKAGKKKHKFHVVFFCRKRFTWEVENFWSLWMEHLEFGEWNINP